MHVEYSHKPSRYEMVSVRGVEKLVLRDNIHEVKREDGTVWVCDEYELPMCRRRGLDEDVTANFDRWLELAKQADAKKAAKAEAAKLKQELDTKIAEILLDYDFRLMMLEELGGSEI